MIVATFRPGTPAAGQTIEYDDGVFRMSSGAMLVLGQLLDYDRAGWLEWAYDGLREWAFGLASAHWAQPAAYATELPQTAAAPRRHSPWLIVAIVVAVVVVTVAVLAVIAAIAIPAVSVQRDTAKESAVKEGVHSIQVGVQSWAVDHNDQWPDPSIVTEDGLGRYVDTWPRNPYTGDPMHPGTGAGDYTYSLPPTGGRSFTLTGYGESGTPVITLP